MSDENPETSPPEETPSAQSTHSHRTQAAKDSRHHTASGKSGHKHAHPPKRKRGPVFWIVVTVLCVAAAIWTVRFIHHSLVFEDTDDAYAAGHVHQISARIAGTVREVLVEDHQAVKAGDVLARLDPLALEIALQKAKAALAQSRAQEGQAQAAVEQAKADAAQAQAMVQQAQARVDQTLAQLDVAKVNATRNERLFQNDARAVSKAEVDSTRSTAQATSSALDAAKADVAAARAKAQSVEAAASSAQAQLVAAQAGSAAQEAAVRDAEREFSYTTITAPVDGWIGNKNVEVGNRVQVGQALIALVSPEVWIMANFKETQLKKMRVGQPVDITVDAIEGRRFTGKVESISPATGAQFAMLPPDNATGNFTKVVQRVPVKIVFDPESTRGVENRLRPGLSTVISVRVK